MVLPFLVAMTVAALAEDPSMTVALSETPAAVQKTIQTQTADGNLGDIDKVRGDLTTYDVGWTSKDGQVRDFSVSEDGALLSVEVSLADTPRAVQKSVNTLLMSKGVLESVDKNLDDSETTYDVELTTTNGQEKEYTLANDGALVSMEVALNETPDAVQKTIATQLIGGKLEDIDKVFDDAEISYEVKTTKPDGHQKNFTVETNGSVSSVEVTLEETAPAARNTITDRMGNGRILQIDRSFVKKKGVFPYEVEGLKDGKPFDFSVGPKGRFLGMDD
jgi:uncharacterized membrane protein YkoI